MSVSDLPALNASLNGLSAVFILLGLAAIKAERKIAHAVCMATAFVTSTLFLACYLTYHYLKAGHVTHFNHPGWPKTLYFIILGTHTPLAVIVLPFIIMTLLRAIQARFDSHRRWAKWTAPMWLYVSVTGVLVYLMLYVWFPAAAV
jgi:putative membrane protein